MSCAGKPSQSFIIPDKLLSGKENIESVSSQLGQVPGVVSGSTGNLGRAFPVQSGILTDSVTDQNYLVKKAGDSLSGEWVYKKSTDTEYYGGSDPRRFWGFHTSISSSPGSDNCCQAYSYVYQKIIIISIDSSTNTVYVSTQSHDDPYWQWTTLTSFTLTNAIASGDCSAQLSVLDDGRLMLLIRTQDTGLSPSVDYDVYHSIDGGSTFELVSERIVYNFTIDNTFGTHDTDNQFRVAVSGDYIRLCWVTGSGVLNTWLSRDRGITWQRITANPGSGDFSLGTTSDPDEPYPFDIVDVDNSGTFLITVIDPSSTVSTKSSFCNIDGAWTALITPSTVTCPAIVRSIAMVRSNNYIWQFTFYMDDSIPDSGWVFRRVIPSDFTSWIGTFPSLPGWQQSDDPISQNSKPLVTESCDNFPGRLGAIWTKDKIFIRGALQRRSTGVDRSFDHCWSLGGWETRSVPKSHPSVRLDQLQGDHEYSRFWNQVVGDPGAAPGSTWTQSTAGTGAVSNSVARLQFTTNAISDEAEAIMGTAITNNWGEGGNEGCVWGFTVEVDAGSGDLTGALDVDFDYMAVRINATSTAGGGGVYISTVRLSDTAIKLVSHGPSPTTDTITGLDLTVRNEIRVSMQQNPSTLQLEQQVAVYNTVTKVWTVGNAIVRSFSVSVASEVISFGMISPVPVAGPWSCRFFDFWLIEEIPDNINLIDRNNPQDLFGQVMSASPLQTEDGMLVSWSGAGAAISDAFTGIVNYSYSAQSTLFDCPRVQWRASETRLTKQLIAFHNEFSVPTWVKGSASVTTTVTANTRNNPYGVIGSADNINVVSAVATAGEILEKQNVTLTEGAGYTVCFWARQLTGASALPLAVSVGSGTNVSITLTASWKFHEVSCIAGSGSGIALVKESGTGTWDVSIYDIRAAIQPFVIYDANPTTPATNQSRDFFHDAASVFGTNVRRWIIDYSDNANFVVKTTDIITDSILFATGSSALSVSSVSDNTISFSPSSYILRGSLLGKFIRFTSGASVSTDSYSTWKVVDHQIANKIIVETYQPAGNPEHQGVAADDQFIVFDDKSAVTFAIEQPYRYCRLRAYDEQVAGLGPSVSGSPFQLGTLVIGKKVQIDVPLDWSFTDSEQSNVTNYRTRGAVTWAYNEGPPQRVITARLVGDVERYRDVIRYFQRYLQYETRALAIMLDTDAVDASGSDARNGPEKWLVLARIVSGNAQDNAAWYLDSDGVLRVAGDLSLTFNEEV